MFPGMFGGGPEPLPEHQAQEQFWKGVKHFICFAAAITAVSAFARHIEHRAHDAIMAAMEDNASVAQATTVPAVEDLLTMRSISIEPNCCPLSAPLALTIPFRLAAPVKAAFWNLHYEADVSAKRHTIPLLTTSPPKDLDAGDHMFQEAVQSIPTEGVKEKYLMQVGMLKLELRSGTTTEPLVSINMVTQVTKDDQGVLRRNVISPLEE